MNKKIKEVNEQLAHLKYPTLAESSVENTNANAKSPGNSPRSTPEPSELNETQEESSVDGVEGVDIVREKPSYSYLTRMPIHQLTFEKKRQLEKEADSIKMQIEDLRAKPIQKIWYDELQELKAVWMEHKQTIEEEYELDRKTRPSTASSSKKKK
jgi:hypothetical protein